MFTTRLDPRIGSSPRTFVPFELSSVNLSPRYVPTSALVSSVLIHGTLLSAALLLSLFSPIEPPRLSVPVTFIHLRKPVDVFYLPVLPGTDPGINLPRERTRLTQSAALPAASKAPAAAYPGPQPIVSQFPDATNHIQTILQPALQQPLALKTPVLLPNVVQPANVGPVMQSSAAPKDAVAAAPPLPDFTIKLPERTLPISNPALSAMIERPRPPDTSKMAPPAVTAAAEAVTAAGKAAEPLVILSPIPTPRESVVSIPAGEAKGNFAISPAAAPTAPKSVAETKAGVIERVPAAAKSAGGSGAGSASAAGSPGKSGDAGTSAAAAAPSRIVDSGFPGITILGGTTEASDNRTSAPAGRPIPPATSYDSLTLISTGTGGSLPQVGVFANEQVYTVYLDVRKTTEDVSPSWVFEYAILNDNTANGVTVSQSLSLPFPVVRDLPDMPVDLVRRYSQQMILVYGVVNPEGKISQLVVKDSPDRQLNAAVLSALGHWTFRPAQLGGAPVAVKVLIGIPLYPSE